MNDEAAGGKIQDPIFGDAGAGVERGLDGEIEGEGGVGDLDDEIEVARLGRGRAKPAIRIFRFNTIRSGTGSLVGLSSGATSMGAS